MRVPRLAAFALAIAISCTSVRINRASAGENADVARVQAHGTTVGVERRTVQRAGSAEDRTVPSKKRRQASASTCKNYSVASAASSYDYEQHGLGSALIPGHRNEEVRRATGWRRCYHANGTVSSFLTHPAGPHTEPVPQVHPTVVLVEAAEAKISLPALEIVTSPPRRGPQLVSVPVWFWANEKVITETASISGLGATVRAEPAGLRIEITGGTGKRAEDNVTIDCKGLGTAYDRRTHAVMAASDCSHAFDWNGTFTVTATLRWDLHWTATTGEQGDLPDKASTTTFPLKVEQAQAVTD